MIYLVEAQDEQILNSICIVNNSFTSFSPLTEIAIK